MNETFMTGNGYTLTAELAQLDALLAPLETGRHGEIRGTVVVLRSHKDGEPDMLAAFTCEAREGGWRLATEHMPDGTDPARWADHLLAERTAFPASNLAGWLDELSGGTWAANGVPGRPRSHTHRYGSQVLRHEHEGGDTPHGYFGHPEDREGTHLTGKLS